jgi:hypothetical protein
MVDECPAFTGSQKNDGELLRRDKDLMTVDEVSRNFLYWAMMIRSVALKVVYSVLL